MRVPLYQNGFVSTTTSKKVDALMKEPRTHVIVISGLSGGGKSITAQESCAKLWYGALKDHKNKIFRQFNCANLGTLSGDIASFNEDLKLGREQSQDEPTWEMIATLRENLKESLPQHHKILIFDDVEEVDVLLGVLDHWCRLDLDRGEDPTSEPPLCKILVTSQKQPSTSGRGENIGKDNFITLSGFSRDETLKLFRFSEIEDELVDKIRDMLGPLPLALKICMKSLESDKIDDRSEFVDNYFEQIRLEAQEMTDNGRTGRTGRTVDKSKYALISMKVSIERLIKEYSSDSDSRAADDMKTLIQILTFCNEQNISVEMLVACAETVVDDPAKARSILVKKLTSRLMDRGLCGRDTESGVYMFALHKLVKDSMRLFVRKDDERELIQKCLIALTRVMPKDGRRHQSRLAGFYPDHGVALDTAIKRIEPNVTPFIQFLHCHMLMSMGYCLHSRSNGLQLSRERLVEARNKYCELVMGPGTTYERLVSQKARTCPPANIHKEIAEDLYDKGQSLSALLNDADFKRYVEQLPLYHHLTKKDLANMDSDITQKQLVNDHLTKDLLERFRLRGTFDNQRHVIDAGTLGRVCVAERLALIYRVLAWIDGKSAEDDAQKKECIGQIEAAVATFNRIYDVSKVYLLDALIAQREMLKMKLDMAKSADEVLSISQQLAALACVYEDPGKQLAFEEGLMKSDVSKDTYHKLLCKQTDIICQGRLHAYSDDGKDEYYSRGKRLLVDVEVLAQQQVSPHSAFCSSYRLYAEFLSDCQKFDEAILYIFKAMLELKEYCVTGETVVPSSPPPSAGGSRTAHPELDEPRFADLIDNLEKYRLSHMSTDDPVKALKEDSPEAKYLKEIVSILQDEPAVDENRRLTTLDYIFQNWIEPLDSPPGSPADD